MTDTIYTGQTPASSDFDGANHGWGMEFTVSDNCDCTGGRAWVPSGGRPATFFWQLWRVSDTTKIAESDLRAAGHGTPSNGAWMSFDSSLFSTPGDVALDSAEDYIVNVYFDGGGGGGVFTDPGSFPIGSGGLVSSSTGRFHNGSGQNAMPNSTSATYFFADVDADSGSEPSEVTLTAATVNLTAQSFTATPGVVTVALTPAVVTSAAQQFTATPGVVTVALTSATVSLAAQAFTATPGLVTVNLTPAAATLTAQVFSTGQDIFTSITVGRPHGRWHVGPPHGRWHVGRPKGQ